AIQYCPPGSQRTVRSLGIYFDNAVEDFGREIVVRRVVKKVAIVPPDHAEASVAQSRGAFAYRIENRLGISRRPTNDVEHLAGCHLMFERFGKIARARLYLVKQTRVLYRDNRLVGESLK